MGGDGYGERGESDVVGFGEREGKMMGVCVQKGKKVDYIASGKTAKVASRKKFTKIQPQHKNSQKIWAHFGDYEQHICSLWPGHIRSVAIFKKFHKKAYFSL